MKSFEEWLFETKKKMDSGSADGSVAGASTTTGDIAHHVHYGYKKKKCDCGCGGKCGK